MHQEHPSGAQYATYLQAIAETNELSVKTGTDVTAVNARDGGFDVEVKPAKGGIKTTLKSRYVVWAAGEFQHVRRADVSPTNRGGAATRIVRGDEAPPQPRRG